MEISWPLIVSHGLRALLFHQAIAKPNSAGKESQNMCELASNPVGPTTCWHILLAKYSTYTAA